MKEHLTRLLGRVDAAARDVELSEAGVVKLALTVEAVANTMEGDVPECVRRLVREFAAELEILAFTVEQVNLLEAVSSARHRFEVSLEDCIRD